MAKYIIEIPDEVPVSEELVPFDMCRPSWYLEAYEKGKAEAEDEVWEFAKIIGSFNGLAKRDLDECFGHTTIQGVMTTYDTYREARAKYDAWKQEKEEIRTGDEVRCMNRVGIVVRIDSMDGGSNVIWEGGATSYIGIKDLTKTGRHFDEVEKLLERMREE